MFAYRLTTMDKIKKIWKEWKVTIFVILAILIIRSTFINWYNIPSSSMNPTLIKGDVVTVNMMAYDIKLPFTDISLYKVSEPEYGDVVGVIINGTRYVKRVIAKPNDVIEMKNNVIYINGQKLEQRMKPVDLEYLPLYHGENEIRFKSYIERHDDVEYPIVFAYGVKDHENDKNVIHFNEKISKNFVENFDSFKVPEGEYFLMGDNRNLSKDSRIIGTAKKENIIGKLSSVAFNYSSIWTEEISARFLNDI